MAWIIALCISLSVTVIALSVKITVMRRSAVEISEELCEKLKGDTNTLITISTRDKAMRCLANNINIQLGELRKQRRRFVQGDIELKNAVTNISHDLRTPITAISGYLDLMEKTEKSEATAGYIEIVKSRTEVLKQLVEEFFRYSVITSPEYDNHLESVAVNDILEECIAGLYGAIKERRIKPDIHMPENKVVRRADPAALSRIFSNLISNAIKYSDGDLHITLTDGGKVTFSNTARELSKVEVERLFDRFYTVENARKSTGLGLSISRMLIERINGTISAVYENGKLNICVQLPDD